MLPNMQVLVEDTMYVSHGKIPMSTEGMLCISRARGFWSYLMVLSTSRHIGMPAEKILLKVITPKGRW